MNLSLVSALAYSPKELIIQFIVAVLIIGAIAGLIYCVERWIHPIPDPAKLIIAIVLVLGIILWAVNAFL